jgi:hypothetical protein
MKIAQQFLMTDLASTPGGTGNRFIRIAQYGGLLHARSGSSFYQWRVLRAGLRERGGVNGQLVPRGHEPV